MRNILGGRRTVIAAGLLIAFYVCYQIYARNRAANQLQEDTLENAVYTVSITHAKSAAATERLTLPGNITAWYAAPIYAQVSGYVKMWYKDYGAHVKRGDVLAEINAPALDAQYNQALAALESQKAKYNLAVVSYSRWAALRKSHAVSEQSISVQEANMKSEAALVDVAQHNVNNFVAREKFKTIVAPYDGVVTSRNINVGDYINKEGTISDRNAITNLFSVADISMMRLFISVPESFGKALKPGLTADVTTPQFPNRLFTAKFLTVANGFDPNTRTAVTEFTIDNRDGVLWPGSYASVALTLQTDEGVLSIPSSSMVFDENGTQVATLTADDHVHFVPIKVGRILDGTIDVLSGVTKTDRIINNPSAALLEDDKVDVVTPASGYDLIDDAARDKEKRKDESDSKEKSSEEHAPSK